MRVSIKISLCLFVFFVSVLNNGCKKDPPKVLPTIETAIPINITSTSATSGGNISDDGGAPVINKGVCWSTNQFPTTNDSKISNGSGIGSFTSIIIGLIPGSTYYLRSFASNVVGTAYGNQIVLSTLSVLPILTTTPCSSITSTTAVSGGNISYDGGGIISERGICWNTNQNPTTSDNKLINGSGTGSFISNITGLIPGATYHLRAYAINSAGTAYGNQITMNALANLPTLTTTPCSSISSTTAISGGNISYDGGGVITERGICWSTNQNPTTSDNKLINGTGTGSFTSNITGLTPGTTYHLRAYAINSAGTAYGNQITITALANLPTLTTTAILEITSTTITSGGSITNNGGAAIISRGVCCSTSPNPTISDRKTINGSGSGDFISTINGLTPNRTYYIRAFATNSQGTSYGSQLEFTTRLISEETLIDIDGNVYNIIPIGTQVWTTSNLKTTKYNDGISIPLITVNSIWSALSTPGYCWVDNRIEFNKEAYGALYNWFAVNTGKLCPTGWHVPTDSEWTTLINFLGGSDIAAVKMKEVGTLYWASPNVANNSSEFSARGNGLRNNEPNQFTSQDYFMAVGSYGTFWSSTQFDNNKAFVRVLFWSETSVFRGTHIKTIGQGVRCVKN